MHRDLSVVILCWLLSSLLHLRSLYIQIYVCVCFVLLVGTWGLCWLWFYLGLSVWILYLWFWGPVSLVPVSHLDIGGPSWYFLVLYLSMRIAFAFVYISKVFRFLFEFASRCEGLISCLVLFASRGMSWIFILLLSLFRLSFNIFMFIFIFVLVLGSIRTCGFELLHCNSSGREKPLLPPGRAFGAAGYYSWFQGYKAPSLGPHHR